MRRRRDGFLVLLAAVAIALLAGRAALPFIVRDYVNGRLHALEAYDGTVRDVDVAVVRGAYRIDGIDIVKRGADQPTPFFTGDRIDLSVEWRSLLRGSLVSEAVFFSPHLNLVQEKSEEESQTGEEEEWHRRIQELFPFRFNTIEVRDGTVTFRAPGIATEDALVARNVQGVVTNLTNAAEKNEPTFAEFRVSAAVLGEAPLKVNGRLDPFSEPLVFDVNLALESVRIPELNPWLRKYASADAESGSFELYLEVAASEGRYEGYAKPILHDPEFFSVSEPEKKPLRRLWEGTVELAAELFENQPRNQVAARVPFSGTIDRSRTDILAAIVSVLRNAFVKAFTDSLEGSISLRDVEGGAPNGGAPVRD